MRSPNPLLFCMYCTEKKKFNKNYRKKRCNPLLPSHQPQFCFCHNWIAVIFLLITLYYIVWKYYSTLNMHIRSETLSLSFGVFSSQHKLPSMECRMEFSMDQWLHRMVKLSHHQGSNKRNKISPLHIGRMMFVYTMLEITKTVFSVLLLLLEKVTLLETKAHFGEIYLLPPKKKRWIRKDHFLTS